MPAPKAKKLIDHHTVPRSLKKGPYVHPSIFKKLARTRIGDSTVIKTWSRASEVAPEMVGYTFGVHNGKNFIGGALFETIGREVHLLKEAK